MGKMCSTKKILGIPLFLLGSVFLSTCVEEYDLENLPTNNLSVETAVDAPLANVEVTMKDVFLHRGSSGMFVTKDSTYDIRYIYSEEKVPLPNDVMTGTEVVAKDTLKDLDLNDYFGPGEIIDSLEAANLKFKVINELPFSVNVEVRFLRNPSEKEGQTNGGALIEMPSLKRSFTVNKCEIDPSTKALGKATESNVSLRFDGADTNELQNVEHIEFIYNMKMEGDDYFHITQESAVKIFLSGYLKARIVYTE